MGTREQENRKRKAVAKSCQSLDTWVSEVPSQEPSDADYDSTYQEVGILNGTLFFSKIMSEKEIKAFLMTN